MSNSDFLADMPPNIYFWIHDEIDGGDLDPFIAYYASHGELFHNKVDFINGFTLAVAYLHHERFTIEELKWVRIATSALLAKILTS